MLDVRAVPSNAVISAEAKNANQRALPSGGPAAVAHSAGSNANHSDGADGSSVEVQGKITWTLIGTPPNSFLAEKVGKSADELVHGKYDRVQRMLYIGG